MATLRVPGRYRQALVQLNSLTAETVDRIRAALARAPSAVLSEATVPQLLSLVPTEGTTDPRALVEALISLYLAKCSHNKNASEVAGDVANGLMTPAEDEAASIADQERPLFVERLTKLLSVPEFDVGARAATVQTEYQNIFSGTRVLTDIRPIFASSESLSISAFIAISNLRIAFRSAGQEQEIFVAMSIDDLSELSGVLEREVRKLKVVTERLTAAGLTVIR